MSVPTTCDSLPHHPPVAPPVRRPELWPLALLLLVCNLGLLHGAPATALVFRPEAVAAGQWWRLLSWPFVHVGGYHLLLDGSAFLLLLTGLEEPGLFRRFGYLLGAVAGSLLLPLAVSPLLQSVGLCGLSGIDHGLLAVTALELYVGRPRKSELRRWGLLLLAGLAAKCLWELATGQVLFAALHLGAIGTPIVATHTGGVLGGVAAFLLLRSTGRRQH